jgi:hypothetical protein
MTSLNSITENVVFKLGQQFNHTLKESVKLDFIHYRSAFIRRDLERNPLNYLQYIDSFCIELEKADRSFCTDLPSGCTLLRSKNPLTKPVRLKSNGRTDFYFVGTINKSKSFVYADLLEMGVNAHLPLQSTTIYYGYMKGHLVIFNNMFYKKILIELIVDDPRDIIDCSQPDTFPDDRPLKLPTDMIKDITNLIIREHRNPIEDGKEVNIEKED